MSPAPERILIWGAGGHGKVAADVVRACGFEVAGFADADPVRLGRDAEPGGARVVVPESELMEIIRSGAPLPALASALLAAVGDNSRRLACVRSAGSSVAPALVHPTASISPSAALGRGTLIMAGAAVNAAAAVGEAVIVNTGAIVEHDCILGDGVHVSPGAVLGGGVRVGDESWIGAGATVIQGVTVGRGAIVGAGAVIIRNVPDGVTIVGNPGRIVNFRHHRRM